MWGAYLVHKRILMIDKVTQPTNNVDEVEEPSMACTQCLEASSKRMFTSSPAIQISSSQPKGTHQPSLSCLENRPITHRNFSQLDSRPREAIKAQSRVPILASDRRHGKQGEMSSI